jgi:hypothetical protein
LLPNIAETINNITGVIMIRLGCDHCGETYHEDNLGECINCGADTCGFDLRRFRLGQDAICYSVVHRCSQQVRVGNRCGRSRLWAELSEAFVGVVWPLIEVRALIGLVNFSEQSHFTYRVAVGVATSTWNVGKALLVCRGSGR